MFKHLNLSNIKPLNSEHTAKIGSTNEQEHEDGAYFI